MQDKPLVAILALVVVLVAIPVGLSFSNRQGENNYQRSRKVTVRTVTVLPSASVDEETTISRTRFVGSNSAYRGGSSTGSNGGGAADGPASSATDTTGFEGQDWIAGSPPARTVLSGLPRESAEAPGAAAEPGAAPDDGTTASDPVVTTDPTAPVPTVTITEDTPLAADSTNGADMPVAATTEAGPVQGTVYGIAPRQTTVVLNQGGLIGNWPYAISAPRYLPNRPLSPIQQQTGNAWATGQSMPFQAWSSSLPGYNNGYFPAYGLSGETPTSGGLESAISGYYWWGTQSF